MERTNMTEEKTITSFKMMTEYRLVPHPSELTEEWLNQWGSMGWSLQGQFNNTLIFMRIKGATSVINSYEPTNHSLKP